MKNNIRELYTPANIVKKGTRTEEEFGSNWYQENIRGL